MFFLHLILAVMAVNGVMSDTIIAQVSCNGGSLVARRCLIPHANKTDFGLLEARLKHGTGCTKSKYYVDRYWNGMFLWVTAGCSGTFDIVKLELPAYNGGCGVNIAADGFRIIGGERVQVCQYPWMVHVSTLLRYTGGFIIDKDHIITTAEIVHSIGVQRELLKATDIEVLTGSPNFQKGAKSRRVQKIFTFPDYKLHHTFNNIAILRLNKSIKFDDCHSPVCLGKDKHVVNDETNCRIMGWGRTDESTRNSGAWLFSANETIIPDSNCKTEFPYDYPNGSVFCGNADHTALCNGDAGSPMVCLDGNKWFAYGIVSEINKKGCENQIGLYTSIPHYYEWIQRTIDNP